jgi:hypothetical protein
VEAEPPATETVLDIDFVEQTPQIPAQPVVVPQVAEADPVPSDDVFDFEDLDTPAFLKRERKLFQ